MANNHHLDIVKRGVEAWNGWRVKNPKIIPDLTEANLGGYNLAGSNFTKTQFNSANLSDTNLRGADLSEANFSTVRFDTIYSQYNSAKESARELHRQAVEERKSSSDYEYWMDVQDSLYGLGVQIEYNQNHPQPSESEKKLKNAMLSSKIAQLLDSSRQFTANLVAKPSPKATLLINSCLIDANLRGTNLFGAVLKNADLRSSNFSEAHAIGADFGGANLTGACIASWNIDNDTNLSNVICEYIYLKEGFKDRRPRSGKFSSGEFTTLFQRALSTIDLVFTDGIDWKAFFITFHELESEYQNSGLSVQAIEKKGDHAFIVRLEVNSDIDEAGFESRAKALYGEKIEALEAQYRAELKAKDSEIIIYRHQNTSLIDIIKLQASRPIEVKAVATSQSDSNTFNTDLREAQIANFANQVRDSARQQANQHNYASPEKQTLAEAASEIQRLLRQLEETNPTATEIEQIAYVNVAAKPDLKQRAIAALKAGGDTAIDEFFLENKYLKVGKAVVKAWLQPSS